MNDISCRVTWNRMKLSYNALESNISVPLVNLKEKENKKLRQCESLVDIVAIFK